MTTRTKSHPQGVKSRTICKVAECHKRAVAHFYCNSHYHRLRRYGDPTFSPLPDYTNVNRSLVNVWNAMRTRCFNPNSKSYNGYGSKGIVVCEAWRRSYLSFISDMGPRPSPDMTLDRIDNKRNYSCGHCPHCIAQGWPANVRWATRLEQSRNSSAVHWITVDGAIHTIAEWSRLKGFGRGTISDRLLAGWNERDAVLTPIGAKRGNY